MLHDPDSTEAQGRWQLLIVVAVIAVVWLVVLPRAAQHSTVRSRIDWLDEKQIDPAAMFYTDLPMADKLLEFEK